MSLHETGNGVELQLEQRDPTSNRWEGQLVTGERWTVYCGDAATTLRSLDDVCFDACITSPPYFWLRDYGEAGQIGLEATVDDYVQALLAVTSEVKRTLKPTGLFFLNLGDTYYSGKGQSKGEDAKSKKRRFGLRAVDKSGGLGIGLQMKSLVGIPWRVALAMMESGWTLRSTIVWHRPKRLREHVQDRPVRSYEYVFMFSRSRRYFFDKQALIDQHIDEDVWTIVPERRSPSEIDTAPYPEELVRRCLTIGCPVGGHVLDPFVGSGTTMRVSLNLGYSATGVDLNPAFCSYTVSGLDKLT